MISLADVKRPVIVAFLNSSELLTKAIIGRRSSVVKRNKNRRRSRAKEKCTINKHRKQNKYLGVKLFKDVGASSFCTP